MLSELTQEALVEVVDSSNIVTNRATLIEYDLNTCKDEELDFEAPFELHLNDSRDRTEVHQLVVSFDLEFAAPNTRRVSLSAGCPSEPTHWKQCVLWFDAVHECPVLVESQSLRGTFRMKRNPTNHRAIDMAVKWEVTDEKSG